MYSGPATVGGIQTYKFIEDVAPAQFATQSVPGSLVGMQRRVGHAPEFNELHLIYYVDPQTGALINVRSTRRSPCTTPPPARRPWCSSTPT